MSRVREPCPAAGPRGRAAQAGRHPPPAGCAGEQTERGATSSLRRRPAAAPLAACVAVLAASLALAPAALLPPDSWHDEWPWQPHAPQQGAAVPASPHPYILLPAAHAADDKDDKDNGNGDGVPKEGGGIIYEACTLPEDTSGLAGVRISFNSTDDTYGPGKKILIRVEGEDPFGHNEGVQDLDQTSLKLDVGGPERFALYLSHENGPEGRGGWGHYIDYVYTVESGDASDDLDYAGNSSLYWYNSEERQNLLNNATAKADIRAFNCLLPEPGDTGSLSAQGAVVVDGVAPTVLRVASDATAGPHPAGTQIYITVTMSEPVSVDGSPLLELAVGHPQARATYVPDDGTSTPNLRFLYTVRSGDDTAALDYARPNSLKLNGISIKDGVDIDAELALPPPGGSRSLAASGVAIDTVAPGATAAVAVSNSTVRVSFDDNVTSSRADGMGWIVTGTGGERYAATAVSAVDTPRTTGLDIALDGDGLPGTDTDGLRLAYNASRGGVADLAGNALASFDIPLLDGIPPEAESLTITGPGRAVINYTEPVNASLAAFRGGIVLSPGGSGAVTGLEGNGTARHAILFGGGDAANATGTLTIDGTLITDASSNRMDNRTSFTLQVADGQYPSVVGAAAVRSEGLRDTIRVVLSEPVMDADAGLGIRGDGWSVSGGEAGDLVVDTRRAIGEGSNVVTLRLNGSLPDDSPSGILLSYEAAGDHPVADASGNALAPVRSLGVSDGIAPRMLSASLTDDREVTVTYSEPVDAPREAYANVTLAGGTTHLVSSVADNDTAVHVLALAGEAAVPRGSRGNVTINASAVLDHAVPPNRLGDGYLTGTVLDDRSVSIISSKVTGPRSVTVQFNASAVQLEYATLHVEGIDRAIGPGGYTGGGTSEHVVRFDDPVATPSATGWFTIDPRGIFVGPMNLTLGDGQNPSVAGARATSLNEIRVAFDEPVTGSGISGPGGWTILGGDYNSRAVDRRSDISTASTELVLTLDGGLLDDSPQGITLAYDRNLDSIADATAGNPMLDVSTAVADAIVPRLLDANMTGGNNFTVYYSENVTAPLDAYDILPAGETARNADRIEGNGTSAHTVVFPGTAIPHGAPASAVIDENKVRDVASSPNPLGVATARSEALVEARSLSAPSAEIISPTQVRITYATAASTSYGTLTIGGTSTGSFSVTGNHTATHTITHSIADVLPSADGSIVINPGTPHQIDRPLTDGQKPTIVGARATSLNEIRVTFDEPVVEPDASGPGGWTISGGDSNSRAVSSRSGISAASAELVLALDGGLLDDSPQGITLAYAPPPMGGIPDEAGNRLAAASMTVADAIVPRLLEANMTGGNNFTVYYSENVTAPTAAYKIRLDGGSERDADSLAGNGTSAHTVVFPGTAIPHGAPASAVIDENKVRDVASSPNPLGGATARSEALVEARSLSAPSAEIISPTQVRITYATAASTSYGTLTIGGTSTGSFTVAGNHTATHTITHSIADVLPSADGSIVINPGTPHQIDRPLTDGQKPTIVGARATSLNEIRVTFDEPVVEPDASGPGGWTISGGDSNSRAVSSRSGISAASAELVLALDGGLLDDSPQGITLAYAPPPMGGIPDEAGNRLAAASMTVADAIVPRLLEANMTGGNNFTVYYSENVTAPLDAYDILPAGETARNADRIEGNGTSAHTVMFPGTAIPHGAPASAVIDENKVRDVASSPNPLGVATARSEALVEARSLSAPSAEIISPTQVRITYATAASTSYGTLTIGGTSTGSFTVAGNHTATHTITHSIADVLPSADGSIVINPGTPHQIDRPLTDGQKPTIVGARATSLNEIRVTFDEPVVEPDASGPGGWTISGGDSNSRAVSSRSGISAASAELVLALDGGLLDDSPQGITLAYAPPPMGGIPDEAGNRLAAASMTVADAIVPRLLEANMTGGNNFTVYYSENVTAPTAAYKIRLDGGSERDADSLAGNGTSAHTVMFPGTAIPHGAPASAVIDENKVRDVASSPNPLGGATARSEALAEVRTLSVLSAEIISPTQVRITYATAASTSYGTLTIGGTSTGSFTVAGNHTATHTITHSIADVLPNATGLIVVNPGTPHQIDRPLTDGQKPTIVGARATSLNEIRVTFDEPVVEPDASGPGGWTISGGDSNSRAVSSRSGISAASAELVLALDGGLLDDSPQGITLAYAPPPMGGIPDEAGNRLAAASMTVADAIVPRLLEANMTGGNNFTVYYSENVTAPTAAYKIRLDGGSERDADSLAGNGTSAHTVMFPGTAIPHGAPASAVIDENKVRDVASSPNPLGGATARSEALAEVRTLSVLSAEIISPTQVRITYATAASTSYGTLTIGGTSTGSFTVAGNHTATHTITHSIADVLPNATGLIVVNPGTPHQIDRPLTDGQKPTIVGARATSLSEIRVTFSEPVVEPDASGPGGWTISGGDSNSRAVSSRSGISAASTELVLALDGGLLDDSPQGITLAYAPPPMGGIPDEAGNRLAAASMTVADAIAPRLLGANMTGGNSLDVYYSEPVALDQNAYTALALDSYGHRAPVLQGTGPHSTHTLTFANPADATNVTGTLTVNQKRLVDESGNAAGGTESLGQQVKDGQPPAIAAAAAVSRDRIEVTFTETVSAAWSASDAGGWTATGTGGPQVSSRSDISGAGSHVLELGLSGNLSSDNPSGIKLSYGDDGTATVRDAAGIALPDVPQRAVGDGIAPRILSAEVVDEFKIEILYSEPVGRNVAAYGTLDLGPDGPRAPIGVAGIGASSLHTVTFGGDEAAADNATGTLIVNQTGLEDVSGNALGGNASSREMVADGQRPEIKSSAVTGSNNITVQYSEPVAAPLSAYRSLTLTSHETSLSSAHAIRNFTGNSTHVHVIGFDTAAPNNVAGTLTINATAVLDLAGGQNSLARDDPLRQDIYDDRAPTIVSARVTGSGEAVIEYSRPAFAPLSAYQAIVVDGIGRAPSAPPDDWNGTRFHTLSLDPAGAAPNATGSILIDGPAVVDADDRPFGLAPVNRTLADGQEPGVIGATALSRTQIRVAFDEPVRDASDAGGSGGWRVDGRDAGGSTVASRSDLSSPLPALVLTLDGGLNGTLPSADLSYGDGLIEDAAGNALGRVSARTIADGIPPEPVSASLVAGNSLTVAYSEPVVWESGAYTSLDLSAGGSPEPGDPVESGASDTHTVGFGSPAASTGENGTLAVDGSRIADEAGNAMGAPRRVAVADGQRPAVESARITGGSVLTIVYSEPVARDPDAYGMLDLAAGGPRAPSGPEGGGFSAVHSLTFGEPAAAANATGMLAVDRERLLDRAGIALGTGDAELALADGQRPEIVLSAFMWNDTVEVRYSEPVAAGPSAYSGLAVDTVDAPPVITRFEGNNTALHVVGLDSAIPVHASGTIVVDETAVLDLAGGRNALGENATSVRALFDGRSPTIVSARVAGPGTVEIEYSRPASAPPSAYHSLVVDGAPRTVLQESGWSDARTHELAFAPETNATDATGTISVDGPSVADQDGRQLAPGAVSRALADGQPPMIDSAAAVSRTELRVNFSEAVVDGGGAGGAGGWHVGGADAAAASAVASMSAVSEAALALVLDGSLADTLPDEVVLSYAGGAVRDASGNELGPATVRDIADGIAPEVERAAITGGSSATVWYTEPVLASADPPAYSSLELEPGGPRTIESFTEGLAREHGIGFGGAPAPLRTAGSVAIDLSLVGDGAGNAAGAGVLEQGLADGQGPPARVRATASAAFASPSTVVVEYSAALGLPPSAGARPAYGAVAVASEGASRPSVRDVVSEEGIGTAVHTVRFGGAPVGAGQGGSIEVSFDLEAAIAADGTQVWFPNGTLPVGPGERFSTVVVPPSDPERIVEVGVDTFARTVNATGAGDAARPAINVTGLVQVRPPAAPPGGGAPGAGAGAGSGNGTAVFPGDAEVRIITSFAEVSFPPNATASYVPADGRIELYVSGEGLPRGRVAEALGLDPARLELGLLVEVGDPDAHIVFDLPVRIRLTGQAGGSAFYVNATSGAVVPIGTMCAADGTAPVHAQLGGAGECQIDLDEAGDKVVYTYHLTLFGTARAADAPVDSPPARPPAVQPPAVVVVPPAAGPSGAAPAPPAAPFLGGGGGAPGGGSSGGGVGIGGGRGGGGGGSPLPAGPSAVVLHSAAWDCSDGTMRIVVGAGESEPAVTVLSSGGSAVAERAALQGAPGLAVYEAPLPDDSILSIRAVSADGRVVSTASEVVRTGGACAGEAVFEQLGAGAGSGGGAGTGPRPDGDAGAAGPLDSPGAVPEAEPAATAPGGAAPGSDATPARQDPAPKSSADGRPAFEMEEGRGAVYYVKRYAEQADYREWFGTAHPQYADICEAVGAAQGCVEAHLEAAASAVDGADAGDGIVCRDGMALRDGRCVPDGAGGQGAQVRDGNAEPEPAAPGAGGAAGGGCLIATAAHGTELAPQVQALREYRDETLMSTGHGRAIMPAFSAAYYSFSPHVADMEREHPAVRQAVAALIAPLLYALQAAALADHGSDASVLAHGAAAALLAAGLYAGVPAAAGAGLAAVGAGAAMAARRRRRSGRRIQASR